MRMGLRKPISRRYSNKNYTMLQCTVFVRGYSVPNCGIKKGASFYPVLLNLLFHLSNSRSKSFRCGREYTRLDSSLHYRKEECLDMWTAYTDESLWNWSCIYYYYCYLHEVVSYPTISTYHILLFMP